MEFVNIFKSKTKPEFSQQDGLDAPPTPPRLEDVTDFDSSIENPEDMNEQDSMHDIIQPPKVPVFDKPEEHQIPTAVPQSPVQKEVGLVVHQQEQVQKGLSVGSYGNMPIYVRMNRYREIVANINHIKSDLKRSEDEIKLLEELKGNKDREFNRWRLDLENIQKKLMFADQTLFKR